MEGAIPGTLRMEDAGEMTVGDEGGKLTSKGSHLYLLERFGADGKGEMVIRRLKHTPNLSLEMVLDEPSEKCAVTDTVVVAVEVSPPPSVAVMSQFKNCANS